MFSSSMVWIGHPNYPTWRIAGPSWTAMILHPIRSCNLRSLICRQGNLELWSYVVPPGVIRSRSTIYYFPSHSKQTFMRMDRSAKYIFPGSERLKFYEPWLLLPHTHAIFWD